MKTFKLLTIAGLFAASLAASFGQLITTTVAPSAENILLRSESPHVLNTAALELSSEFITSPTYGVVFDSVIPAKHNFYLEAASDSSSLLWTRFDGAPLISLSEGFHVDVTFIRGVGNALFNTFGVKYTDEDGHSNNKNLFTNYNASTNLKTLRLTSDEFLELDFWNYNLSTGKKYLDSSYFNVFSSFNFETFTTSYIIGVNSLFDNYTYPFGDSVIRIDVPGIPTNPEDPELPSPVPEPSTYGLIGAAALLGLVAYRRKFKK